jgi:hypothetical protein
MKNLLITGTLTFKPDDPLLPLGRYVFQRVTPGKGNLPERHALDLQLRRHVIPLDPKTAPQLGRRALMAAAVARWHATAPEDRQQWASAAKDRNIPLFYACVSDTLRNYHLEAGVLVKN